mmetsp:Transcript_19708/g.49943  ORF Transcript_19708/g.49943 Transcript_19708/m.49943 type:complete len:210 (-) Transcript_19708:168-797(-)
MLPTTPPFLSLTMFILPSLTSLPRASMTGGWLATMSSTSLTKPVVTSFSCSGPPLVARRGWLADETTRTAVLAWLTPILAYVASLDRSIKLRVRTPRTMEKKTKTGKYRSMESGTANIDGASSVSRNCLSFPFATSCPSAPSAPCTCAASSDRSGAPSAVAATLDIPCCSPRSVLAAWRAKRTRCSHHQAPMWLTERMACCTSSKTLSA